MTTTQNLPEFTNGDNGYVHRPVDGTAIALFMLTLARLEEGAAPEDPWEERIMVEQYAIDAEKRGVPPTEVRRTFGDVVEGPLNETQAARINDDGRVIYFVQPAGRTALAG